MRQLFEGIEENLNILFWNQGIARGAHYLRRGPKLTHVTSKV